MVLSKRDVMDKLNELMEQMHSHLKRRECSFCHNPAMKVNVIGQADKIFQYQVYCPTCKRSVGVFKQETNGDWTISMVLPEKRLSFLGDILQQKQILKKII